MYNENILKTLGDTLFIIPVLILEFVKSRDAAVLVLCVLVGFSELMCVKVVDGRESCRSLFLLRSIIMLEVF